VAEFFPLQWNPSSGPSPNLYGSVKARMWLTGSHGAGHCTCAARACKMVPEGVRSRPAIVLTVAHHSPLKSPLGM